jgi:hypothetical protein
MARTPAAPRTDETGAVLEDAVMVLPQLDPHVPPRFVRRKSDGLVTRWSTLFKRHLDQFEPFYRANSDDAIEHAARIRHFEMVAAMKAGRMGMLADMVGMGAMSNDVGLERGGF